MITTSNWTNAIAHIDADAFYASCEAVRHPELKGRPICVLSNQNAMIIARSYDARELGIKTGTPIWEAKRIAPDAALLTPDFRFYGQISDKMFSIMRRYSPEIEVYSIDEGFMGLNGLRMLWKKSFRGIADEIRETIRREIGITVSIGISNTKTLAKIASESNKPNGTTIVPGKRIGRFLADVPAGDIPGIGRNRRQLLDKFGIHTALEFAEADEGLLHRLLGRHGLVLKNELRGRSVLPIETEAPMPRSIARTASMGLVTTDWKVIDAHLAGHVMRLVSELVAKHLLAKRLRLFLTLKSFEQVGIEVRFDYPTNSWKKMMDAVKSSAADIYRPGEEYRGCGVVAIHLSMEQGVTEDLFGSMRKDLRQAELMLTVNRINEKYGKKTLAPAISGSNTGNILPRFKYPLVKAR